MWVRHNINLKFTFQSNAIGRYSSTEKTAIKYTLEILREYKVIQPPFFLKLPCFTSTLRDDRELVEPSTPSSGNAARVD